VTCSAGVGEEVPYDADMFDLVIIHNALDHTFNPRKVLSEIHRVLKVGGISFVAVHTYPMVWLPPLRFLKIIQGSKDHPWRYTTRGIKREVRANSLQILDTQYGGKDELSIPDWLPLTLQLRIARYIGLSVPMLHILARKESSKIKGIC
jgi:SAM-dependent methyltransferase